MYDICCPEFARIFKNNALSSSTADAYRRMNQQYSDTHRRLTVSVWQGQLMNL